MHMWRHVTNHLIISNDKDSNSENRIKLRVRDNSLYSMPLGISSTVLKLLATVFSRRGKHLHLTAMIPLHVTIPLVRLI
jgi:hypothetical protein